jgi:signal transduction histidine kinase
MKSRVIVFIGLFFLWIQPNCFSQQEYTNPEQKLFLEFSILESDFSVGKYLSGDIQKLGFTKYDWGKLPLNKPFNNRMLTLRSNIAISSLLKNEELYLASVFMEYPCHIYLNGNLIAVRGDFKKGYTSRLLFNQNVLLTPSLLKYDTINEITFQLYPKEGETAPFLKVFIADAKTTDIYVFTRNFFNSIFFQAMGFCSIILFLYFVFLYLSHKTYRQKQFLLFSLINLFFAFSYANQIFTYNSANTFLLEKTVRCSQPILIYVSMCFIIEYTNLFRQKTRIYGLLCIPFLLTSSYIGIQSNAHEVIHVYNLFVAPLLFLGAFAMLGLTSIAAYKNRDLKSISLLAVFLFLFLAILHDSFYFSILHTKPYFLQVPYVFFYINLTIFFLMAREQAKIYVLSNSNEKKLTYLNENLEKMVEERTHQLNENSIKLSEANNTKDKFYSIIAHDLRNPFHIIIGYSTLLTKQIEAQKYGEAKAMAKYINDSAKNTYNLLENLLNWAKSQLHLIPFLPEKLNLLMVVDEIIKEAEYIGISKNISIQSFIAIDISVTADKNMLQLIFRNLLTNAIKYSSTDTQIKLIATTSFNQVEISVADNGIGMSAALIEKLFIFGENIAVPGTANEKGSGFGLLLCKEFVEKHGGKLWVESEVGKGSTFKFTLPMV